MELFQDFGDELSKKKKVAMQSLLGVANANISVM